VTRKTKIAASVLSVLALLAAVLWYPYPFGEIPVWKLTVVDSRGNPVANSQANEEWLNPVEEGMTLTDFRNTDRNGVVLFPARKLHNRLLFGNFRQHPSAHVFVCWQDEFGDVFWDESHPELPAKMILKKEPCGYG
jgi:hypothetical protein